MHRCFRAGCSLSLGAGAVRFDQATADHAHVKTKALWRLNLSCIAGWALRSKFGAGKECTIQRSVINCLHREQMSTRFIQQCVIGDIAHGQDLRIVTGALTAADGGGDGGAITTVDGGAPFLVQKFVKSKGPHAFIVRQVKRDASSRQLQ